MFSICAVSVSSSFVRMLFPAFASKCGIGWSLVVNDGSSVTSLTAMLPFSRLISCSVTYSPVPYAWNGFETAERKSGRWIAS
uniref:Putative secreted protein n=1 Tax=Anopheles marajoara TaxID=58244 RepID=A0A2M4CCJ4_9DIPT